MPYAVVRDIPASWEHYAVLASAFVDPLPEGLILHVAGPTDEGFRTIEIWDAREAWRRWNKDRGQSALLQDLAAPPALRELDAIAAVGALGGSPQ